MQNYSFNLVIASTVFGSLIFFGFINLLLILRKRFPVRANCWFCNTNLRVPYSDWNSFTCPKCEQYNGFSDDGDYNREISAQFSSKLNNSTYCQRNGQGDQLRLPHSNGFCEFCSRNQEMKVIQLANFRPRCESTYDLEIEEFKQKLEDSYQLCQQCQRHLNRTLNRVKTKFIGSKITQLRAKYKSNHTAKVVLNEGRFFSTLISITLLILSIVNLVKNMQIKLPSIDLSYINHFYAFIFTFGDILANVIKDTDWKWLIEDVKIDEIAAIALFLNVLLITLEYEDKKLQVCASMLMWSMKMGAKEFPINSSYVLAIEGIVAALLIISSLSLFRVPKKKELDISKNGSFHRIPTELIDDSDTEIDISDASSSHFNVHSNRSTANYSQLSKLNSTYRPSFVAPSKTLNSTIKNSVHNASVLSNKSFNITQEVMAADRKQVQSDIDRLKLSDNREEAAFSISSTIKDFNTSQCSNPFSIERMSRRGSPTPSVASIFSVSSRNQLISPPRLHSPQVYTSEVPPSWVAGGYWQSPPKKYANSLLNLPFKPVMSRSSSQSSGLGTIEGSEKNSRENSLSQEDAASLLYDATGKRRNFFENPSSRTLFPESQFFNDPKTHNNLFNSQFGSGGGNNSSFRMYRESNGLLFNR